MKVEQIENTSEDSIEVKLSKISNLTDREIDEFAFELDQSINEILLDPELEDGLNVGGEIAIKYFKLIRSSELVDSVRGEYPSDTSFN